MARVADQEHTGGMVALVPSAGDVARLTVEGGEPPDELHLTLAYLGDDVTEWEPQQRDAVLAVAHEHSGGGPIPARIMAHALFNPDGHDERDPCAVYLVGDTPQLTPLRESIITALRGAVDLPRQHEPTIFHVTAGYGLNPGALSYVGPIVFDRLRVALGTEVTDFYLSGPPREEPGEPGPEDTETKTDGKAVRVIDAEVKRAGDRDDDGIPDANDPLAGSAPGKPKDDKGKGGKKRRVASEAGEKRYGKPIGTEIGKARNEEAQKAQDDPKAKAAYEKLLTANPREYQKMLDGMNDSELEALTKVAFSFRSSNPQVVQARLALAGALRRRGKDVNDYGGLGKSKSGAGQSSKPAASSSRSGSSGGATAGGKTNRAGSKTKDPTWVGDEDWQARRSRRTKLGLQGAAGSTPPSAKTKRGEGGKMMTLHVYEDGSWSYKGVDPHAELTETSDGAYVFVESKRAFTAEQRRKAPTLPGTDKLPIENEEDLRNAIKLAGKTDEPQEKVWAHIRTQASKLGRMDLVPEEHRKGGSKSMNSWDDVLFDDATDDVEVKRTTTKPWEKPKSEDGADSAIGKGKDKGDDGDEWTIKTIGDLAAAVKRAKKIKDPDKAKQVWKHLRSRAAAIKAPNMIPKDAPGGSGGGGKPKGSGKPWEKGVSPDDLEPDELARWIECKVMSPDPRAAKLREYWAHGPGRAKWRPGTGGDFERLRRHLRKYVPARMLNGLTANIHKLATGSWPGRGRNHGKGLNDELELETKGVALAPEMLAEADALDPDAAGGMGDDDAVSLALDRYADMAGELTSEEEYEQALAEEIDWELLPDGELERADGLDSSDDVNPDAEERGEPTPDDAVDALEEMFSA